MVLVSITASPRAKITAKRVGGVAGRGEWVAKQNKTSAWPKNRSHINSTVTGDVAVNARCSVLTNITIPPHLSEWDPELIIQREDHTPSSLPSPRTSAVFRKQKELDRRFMPQHPDQWLLGKRHF